MTELDIYKFIEENYVETQWQSVNGEDQNLAIWIPHFALKDFCNMLGASIFDDGGIDAILCSGASIYIENFDEICERFGIEPERIVEKEI